MNKRERSDLENLAYGYGVEADNMRIQARIMDAKAEVFRACARDVERIMSEIDEDSEKMLTESV